MHARARHRFAPVPKQRALHLWESLLVTNLTVMTAVAQFVAALQVFSHKPKYWTHFKLWPDVNAR